MSKDVFIQEFEYSSPRLSHLQPNQSLPPDRHPAFVYLARLGPGSRRTMRQAIEKIAQLITNGRCGLDSLPWWALGYQHTAAIRSELAERYRPATANKMIAALRGVLAECWRLGLMSAEDYHRARDVPHIKAETLPRGRALSMGELRGLLGACCQDASPAGARDAALIALLYGAGLRRSEAVALDVADLNGESGEITLRGAKGRKDRISYASNGADEAVADWLEVRGPDPGPLFFPINKVGRLTRRRMSDQAVLNLLVKRARQAGVDHCSPHDLRRSFVSDLLDAGADISTVQRLAGHAHVATTARYDRRGEAAKREAARRLHVPYTKRK